MAEAGYEEKVYATAMRG